MRGVRSRTLDISDTLHSGTISLTPLATGTTSSDYQHPRPLSQTSTCHPVSDMAALSRPSIDLHVIQ